MPNQVGGQHQPQDFYDIRDDGQVRVAMFRTLALQYTVRFRHVQEVDNFPALLHHILEDIIGQIRQRVSF